ncbi:YajG family lipoprotein [Roseomonas sp. F4]
MMILLMPACAVQRDYIEVRHVPTVAPPQVPGAQDVAVSVVTRDDRSGNRERVSVKKNGYGMEMAPIVATNDVVAEVGRLAEVTLQGMGFQTNQERDGAVTVEVHKIWNDFKLGFWSGQAVSEVNTTIAVRARDGRVVFSRMYSVEAAVPEIMIMSGENARLSLVQAFDRLAQRLATDRDLAQALLTLNAAPGTAPPPVAAPPPRQTIPRGGVPLS